MIGKSVLSAVALAACIASSAHARDLHVGGTEPGRFPTLQAAIQAAGPGDTIHLDPAHSPYRETAIFTDVVGRPDQPIILDGHGTTLLGCDPIDPAEWADAGDGLWRSAALAERLGVNAPMLGRFFFVFDGDVQHMGGAFKHRKPTLKRPGDLGVYEWTYAEDEKAFYIRLAAGRPLDAAAVEVPVRATGVALRGECAHVVIRNVKASRVWNDGFNIHGRCTGISFENIEASECGDDGISAHGECEIVVDGYTSRGNANGICHVNQSRTLSRNVHISDSRAHDLYLLDESRHELYDVTIEASSPRGIVLTTGTAATIRRLTVTSPTESAAFNVLAGASVEVSESGLWNVAITVRDAAAHLRRITAGGPHGSLILDRPRDWRGESNMWDVARFVHGGREFDGGNLAAFQAATGQEADSRVRPVTYEEIAPLGGTR